jgi:hypothetical protein
MEAVIARSGRDEEIQPLRGTKGLSVSNDKKRQNHLWFCLSVSILLGIRLLSESPHSRQAHKTKAKKKQGKRLGDSDAGLP